MVAIPRSIEDLAKSIDLNGKSSISFTCSPNRTSKFAIIIYGNGNDMPLSSILFHISGYVTSSRCVVTNITDQQTITITSNDTEKLYFIINNSINNPVTLRFLKLYNHFEIVF